MTSLYLKEKKSFAVLSSQGKQYNSCIRHFIKVMQNKAIIELMQNKAIL